MEPEAVQRPPWYIEPNEGESISHYFGRFRRHEAVCVSSPGSLSKAAGIGPVLARWEKFRLNPVPSQKELEAIAKLIGLDTDKIVQMLPPKGEKMKLEPIRLCAACYAEKSYHRLEWQFQSTVGCDGHKLRLLSECPYCKERFAIPALWEKGECKKCHAFFRSMAKRQKAY
ncbi:TniQ family protein [Desmonostoc muscorum CCALA 125]|nr:TniQ family protein [Desmonostoc muscorum CCALA 125]